MLKLWETGQWYPSYRCYNVNYLILKPFIIIIEMRSVLYWRTIRVKDDLDARQTATERCMILKKEYITKLFLHPPSFCEITKFENILFSHPKYVCLEILVDLLISMRRKNISDFRTHMIPFLDNLGPIYLQFSLIIPT